MRNSGAVLGLGKSCFESLLPIEMEQKVLKQKVYPPVPSNMAEIKKFYKVD